MDAGYQRLVDIARGAGLKSASETHLSPSELEFAERIVIECAGMAYNNIDDEENASRVSAMIFNFFGVK